MKTFIQKISLLVVGVITSMAIHAQTLEVSITVFNSKQILPNGVPVDLSSYGNIVQGIFPVTVTIKNTGSSNLILTPAGGKYVTLGDTGADDFIVDENGISATIVPDGTTTFSVSLSPSATNGTKTVSMSINNNDAVNAAYTGGIKYSFTNLTTSITKASDVGLSLYPNPSSNGQMHVSADNVAVERIVVSNVAGQTEEFTSKEFKTSLTGLLLVHIYTNKGVVAEKIIVNE